MTQSARVLLDPADTSPRRDASQQSRKYLWTSKEQVQVSSGGDNRSFPAFSSSREEVSLPFVRRLPNSGNVTHLKEKHLKVFVYTLLNERKAGEIVESTKEGRRGREGFRCSS